MKRRFWRLMESEPVIWGSWVIAGYMVLLTFLIFLGAS